MAESENDNGPNTQAEWRALRVERIMKTINNVIHAAILFARRFSHFPFARERKRETI